MFLAGGKIYPVNTLRSFWKLNGDANDSVGSNNGTPTDITWGDGSYAQFTSSIVDNNSIGTSVINISDTDSLSFIGVPMTISCMVWFDSLPTLVGTGMMLFNKIKAGSNPLDREYFFYYSQGTWYVKYMNTNPAEYWPVNSVTDTPTTNQWLSFIATTDSLPHPTYKLYINGELKSTQTLSNRSYEMANTDVQASIGNHSSGSNNTGLNGRLKQMGLWESYFSDAQALALHKDLINGVSII